MDIKTRFDYTIAYIKKKSIMFFETTKKKTKRI